ncbi:hypothetical protein SY28_01135 [Meiothermus taiwanensis]|nr:hypothetical protein SY28_01135 [Meiothermus taiwanensis]
MFDEASLAAVREQLRQNGRPWVLDWHHATLDVEAGKRDKAPAAGFIQDVVVEEGYVYGLVEWTPEGAADVMKGAFAFISPVLLHTEDGHVVGYHSHALTNRPGTQWQRRIGMEEKMDWLRQMVGLPPDAGEEQVRTALEALQARAQLGDLLVQSLGLSDAAVTPELRARVIRLAANEQVLDEVSRLREQLEQEARQREQQRIQALVEAALEDGRILPNQRELFLRLAASDFEATRMALEALPPRVPTQLPQLQPAQKQERAALSDNDLAVAQLVGVSKEALLKYGGDE